jgi:hypothetical protein
MDDDALEPTNQRETASAHPAGGEANVRVLATVAPSQAPVATSLARPRFRVLNLEETLQASFWCRAKLRKVTLGRCMDDYVSHTTYAISWSNCTNCEQGAANRRAFAESS